MTEGKKAKIKNISVAKTTLLNADAYVTQFLANRLSIQTVGYMP